MEEYRAVPYDDGKKLKDDYAFDEFLETSAKEGLSTRDLFVKAAVLLYENYKKYPKVK